MHAGSAADIEERKALERGHAQEFGDAVLRLPDRLLTETPIDELLPVFAEVVAQRYTHRARTLLRTTAR